MSGSAEPNIIGFSSGGEHACIIYETGGMKCWGNRSSLGINPEGGLGDEMKEINEDLPYVNLGTSVVATKVSCGCWHLCVVLNTTELKCMGMNYFGQLGLGSKETIIGKYNNYEGDNLPVVDLGSELQVIDVELGQGHVCVIVTGNRLKCFGRDNEGQLGYESSLSLGDDPSHMGNNLQFVNLGTNVEVASVHAGSVSFHNCAILSKPTISVQRIKCWGWNEHYQLGSGNKYNFGGESGSMGDNLPLVDLGTESKVEQIILGMTYTCALLVNKNMKCFGTGQYGEIASGSTAAISLTGNSMPIVTIDSGKTIKYIAGGGYHICIVYDDEFTLKCLGDNEHGSLGQGDTSNRGFTSSTRFPFIPAIDLGTDSLTIKAIYASSQANYIIFSSNRIKCFGANFSGQCAIGTNSDIGISVTDMGVNLQYSGVISSITHTANPTQVPTRNASKNPTVLPTITSLSPTVFQTSTKSPTSQSDSNTLTTSLAIGITVGSAWAFILIFFIYRREKLRSAIQARLENLNKGSKSPARNDQPDTFAIAATITLQKSEEEIASVPVAIPIASASATVIHEPINP